ncbi:MAG: carbohydrate ABC transporter permease [Treponema sp.]|jgi:putative aldouronate transport system permease protein|nr:carbohydrate ABC transporter permease [Treponema sp.]
MRVEKRFSLGSILIHGAIALFSLFCILPFILVFITSFASERSIALRGYTFFPAEWSLEAYQMIFGQNSTVLRGYGISVLITSLGTFLAVTITYCAGYAVANKLCKYRNGLSLYFFVTMVFSAGLVPWYMVSRTIGAYNNIWALIVPGLIFSPYNLFLVRNFIKGIPDTLNESARMDGAGEILIAFRIYLPLCLPVLATVALFYAIGYWNNYFNAVMLVNDTKIHPLQMLLFNIQSTITGMNRMVSGAVVTPPRESFKMAASIITMGPIVLLYPFLQRYFVKGVIVGAIKG